MFNNVLVVCVGNICRSPALERLLAAKLPGKVVHSAGLGALVGKPVDSKMAKMMSAGGVNADGHAARQLDNRLVAEADLIIAMEQRHVRAIREYAFAAAGKTMLATQWLDQKDVADPYRKDESFFSACYEQLVACSESWAQQLT